MIGYDKKRRRACGDRIAEKNIQAVDGKPFYLVFRRFFEGNFHVIIISPRSALGKLFYVKISDPSATLRMTSSSSLERGLEIVEDPSAALRMTSSPSLECGLEIVEDPSAALRMTSSSPTHAFRMTSSCPCIWDDKFTLRRRVLVIGFAVRRFPCAEDRRDIVIPYRFPPYRPCHASAFRAPLCHVERSRNISHKIKTEGNCPPFF